MRKQKKNDRFHLQTEQRRSRQFVTSHGQYQNKLKALKCCLVRLVYRLIFCLDECKAYIDYAIIFSEEWEQHLETIREFFKRLSEAKQTIHLTKSDFCHANLKFLGHFVGQGQIRPVEAKVEAISDFAVATGKRQLMSFLGMAG